MTAPAVASPPVSVAAPLRAAGFPTDLLVLDVETFFDSKYSLRRLGTVGYLTDPRFHVHGLAAAFSSATSSDAPRITFAAEPRLLLAEFTRVFGPRWDRVTVLMHNAQFDAFLLQRHFGLSPRYMICTKFLWYGVNGRRGDKGEAELGALVERFRLGQKGDLSFMEGVRTPDPIQAARLANYARNDALLTMRLARVLLPRLSWPEVELRLIDHTVRLFTERSVTLDVKGADALLGEVETEDRRHAEEAGVSSDVLSSTKKFSETLEKALAASGRHVATKRGKKGEIPAVARADDQMAALRQDSDPRVAALARARVEHASALQTCSRLRSMIETAQANGGALPVSLCYYAAHTGRFGGSGGFNFQNLPARGDGANTKIRSLLVARPGHVLVVVDASQIEARITAWLCGERELLVSFGDGKDVYCIFASEVFGEPVREAAEGDSPEAASRMKALREIGKEAVLGLGFGMGALKFLTRLQAKPAIRPLFDRGELTRARVAEIVCRYRERFANIAASWKRLDQAFKRVVRDGGERDPFFREGGDVLACLPSGRLLRYERPKLVVDSRTVTFLDKYGFEVKRCFGGERIVCAGTEDGTGGEDLYGGKLLENLVQATARDVLVLAVLGLEARGYPVLLHVHDEVVLEVPEAEAEQATKTALALLSQDPGWDTELGPIPLAAKGKPRARYGK